MKSEDIYSGITDIRDDLVVSAEAYTFRRKSPRAWRRWGAMAACLCLAVLGGIVLLQPRGRETVAPGSPNAGGSGHGEGAVFMSYAGPAFPLTTRGGAESISAEREIDFDFAAYAPDAAEADPEAQSYGAAADHAVLREHYVLTNHASQDVSFTALYPYAGDLQTALHPSVSVNGSFVETVLYSGPYSGGFTGAGDENSESLNLDGANSWEDYRASLADGSYLDAAFAAYPELTEAVTVYELTDVTDGGSDARAATLCMSFTLDAEKSTVLTYGFDGGGYDSETGAQQRSFFIPKEGRRDYGATRYLIVTGEDIGAYTLQGYADGGCDPGEEIDGAAATVRRYTATLGEVLHDIAAQYYGEIYASAYDGDHNRYLDAGVTFELYYGELCRYFALYGPGGSEPKERYALGMLEDIVYEIAYHERVLYRAFELTVPAGGSVEVEIELVKNASFDFICDTEENRGITGYDAVTALGSDLDFTAQRASLSNTEGIEIVRQNFGFDLAEGIAQVTLDPAQEHYYLEVRRVESD